jgi:D-arabinose 1-dehydrogenase-like Zn-dependent alcohol dehydrogenase
MILGHEMAGRIVEIGSKVQRIHPGDRVTIDSVVGCGQCGDCLRSPARTYVRDRPG